MESLTSPNGILSFRNENEDQHDAVVIIEVVREVENISKETHVEGKLE